jgi:WhiB family redox-sensing transcriptional regulator
MKALEIPTATSVPGESVPGDWSAQANCKGHTHLFFAPKAERPQARMRREARARVLCRACPVSTECKEFARSNREYGFWGGESEEERHLAGYTVAAPIGVRARTVRQTPLAS